LSNGTRETFTSKFAVLMTMIGVAVGLGNFWRFPYMVGKFGGATFVIFYMLVNVLIGIPALMAEWALGRYTRQGTAGAFARAGLPYGRSLGWFFFFIVLAATGYYSNAVGWVLYHAITELAAAFHLSYRAAEILPPPTGFAAKSFVLQLSCTGLVILSCAVVLLRGLRSGIEVISKITMPALLVVLIILIVRALTLPGAAHGLEWYILKFDWSALTGKVMVAALGQTVFSLSLGGTFMVVYGSYLNKNDDLKTNAIWTTLGDSISGVLAGFAIIPAVFALGLEPGSGPGLIFFTLPQVFAAIPAGWLFGLLFFLGLFGAGLLSDIAAFEVLVAGITDNTRLSRTRAVWLLSAFVFLIAIPPMISMEIFVPWDLTFGSGMQTLGCLLAVITVAWVMKRSEALKELAENENSRFAIWLYYWLRFVIPGAIILVGIWWLLTDVFKVLGGV